MVGTYRPNILLNCAEMKVTNNSDSLQYSVMCKKKVFNVPQKSGWSALNNNDWHALKIESSLAGEGSTSSSTHIVEIVPRTLIRHFSACCWQASIPHCVL